MPHANHSSPHRTVSDRLALGLTGALWAGALVAAVALPAGFGGPAASSGLALAFALLTLFVAATVSTFSLRYMRADGGRGRYFATLALLVASVLGFVLARDMVGLAVAWCASGVLLARLIGHSRTWAEAQCAANRALAAFAIGDAALLGALALLGRHAGTTDLSGALAGAATMPPGLALGTALLVLVAAAARCALPPFSGWLLSSMTAPTPVSALMHAGLVNAGGFLLLRCAPLFEAAPLARSAAVAVGLVAALYGVGVMTVRPDVKRALAGSTVSQMGFMIMSCGLGAYAAALWHILAHGLFKAWLFLGSGSAIGSAVPKQAADGTTTSVIALGTLAAGAALTLSPDAPSGSLIPLLLGLATAAATLVAGLRGSLPLRARAAIGVLIAALIAIHATALGLAHALIGADGPALLPPAALIALLALFLGAWVWQQRGQRNAATLPPRLYVHLLNAGSIPAAPEK